MPFQDALEHPYHLPNRLRALLCAGAAVDMDAVRADAARMSSEEVNAALLAANTARDRDRSRHFFAVQRVHREQVRTHARV